MKSLTLLKGGLGNQLFQYAAANTIADLIVNYISIINLDLF